MKKLFLYASFLLFSSVNIAQDCYWQQAVDYEMDIDFDTKKHQFHGTQKLTYTNNSPDTLNRVFYHLYFNAFQPGSMMDVRSRNIADPDKRVGSRISELKPNEIGYHKINSLAQNGTPLKYEVVGTILEVELAEPIAPHSTTVFEMDFDSQVPKQIRRSGRNSAEGVDYSMTQWYPKLSEYDKEGWHANPYIAREFHGVWGNFDVTIHIDEKQILGATGYLQNPSEIGYGYASNEEKKITDGKLTWHWKAENVHDFAWGADPDYAHDIIALNNGTNIHFLYLKSDTLNVEKWQTLQPYAKKLFEIANENFGEYPYKKYSVIQGGDGGMEYPMMTLVTSKGDWQGLVGVTIHEAMHSWYQGIMATNEAKYAWMDEGFTSYAEHVIEDILFEKEQINVLEGYYRASTFLMTNAELAEPLTTHADFFHTNRGYGISAYGRGSVFLQLLGYIVGDQNLQKSLKVYYDTWKFKHPTPDDFKRIAEKVSGLELDWYFEQYIGTLNTPDYGIVSVEKRKKNTEVSLERIGRFPLPVDIAVITNDDKIRYYTIPLRIMRGAKTTDSFIIPEITVLEDWPWVNPTYSFTIEGIKPEDIKQVIIDPTTRMWDINLKNNVYPFPEAE